MHSFTVGNSFASILRQFWLSPVGLDSATLRQARVLPVSAIEL